jgi:hypothetical protein
MTKVSNPKSSVKGSSGNGGKSGLMSLLGMNVKQSPVKKDNSYNTILRIQDSTGNFYKYNLFLTKFCLADSGKDVMLILTGPDFYTYKEIIKGKEPMPNGNYVRFHKPQWIRDPQAELEKIGDTDTRTVVSGWIHTNCWAISKILEWRCEPVTSEVLVSIEEYSIDEKVDELCEFLQTAIESTGRSVRTKDCLLTDESMAPWLVKFVNDRL